MRLYKKTIKQLKSAWEGAGGNNRCRKTWGQVQICHFFLMEAIACRKQPTVMIIWSSWSSCSVCSDSCENGIKRVKELTGPINFFRVSRSPELAPAAALSVELYNEAISELPVV